MATALRIDVRTALCSDWNLRLSRTTTASESESPFSISRNICSGRTSSRETTRLCNAAQRIAPVETSCSMLTPVGPKRTAAQNISGSTV